MCGIAGIFAYRESAPPVNAEELLRIREHMITRGPDDAGTWISPDSRETPSAELIRLLQEKGAAVDYSDPHIPVFPAKRDYEFDMRSVELTRETLSVYDCVVVATDHDAFDYKLIKQCASLIVDTRGVYNDPAANVVKA